MNQLSLGQCFHLYLLLSFYFQPTVSSCYRRSFCKKHIVTILKNYLIYLFLAALGLRCCAHAFSSCDEQGLLFISVHGLLIAVASLVAEHGLQGLGFSSCGMRAQQLWRTGLVAPWHMGSARTRAGTHVPFISRRIPNHCATREVPIVTF